jgi:hypothetical protein
MRVWTPEIGPNAHSIEVLPLGKSGPIKTLILRVQ